MNEFSEVGEVRYRALADPTRRHLLRLLEDSDEPRDIASLAAAVDLHPNTVRGHLVVLEQARLVRKDTRPRETPGRPRLVYSRAPDTDESGGYRLLSEMLTTAVKSSPEATSAIRRAGRQWGAYLVDRPPPSHLPTPDEVVDYLTRMLAALGFAPRRIDDDGADSRPRIDLVDCPFRELAREHPDVVCTLHFGLLEGAAESLGGATSVESLVPFIEPSLCRIELSGN